MKTIARDLLKDTLIISRASDAPVTTLFCWLENTKIRKDDEMKKEVTKTFKIDIPDLRNTIASLNEDEIETLIAVALGITEVVNNIFAAAIDRGDHAK